MHFPQWVDRPRDPNKRAQARLKYLLSIAALRKYGRTSMHALANDIDCNHSSIFNAINRGWFTTSMAERIQKVFGRDELPSEALVDPWNIGGEQT
jgi:hypothetical protein